MKPLKKRTPDIALALLLVMVLLGSTLSPASAAQMGGVKADPRLLQMAHENPDATFMVFVQREVRNQYVNETEPETDVVKGGGRVKKQLRLIESFSAELTGKQIIKLARKRKVRWISADAPMVLAARPGMETVRDEFPSPAYDGNRGTQVWSTNWIEGDPAGDAAVSTPTTGVFLVSYSSRCAGGTGYCLQIAPDFPGGYLYREVNLGSSVSVWLSFYRNNLLNANSGGRYEQVQLQISPNGGASWTTLQTYSGTSNIGVATESFDISAYATARTQIRFLMPTVQAGSRYIFFDNIEIAYSRPSVFLSAVGADQVSLDGHGITVAVVDSGITTTNDDFNAGGQSRILAETYFGSKQNPRDQYGHGTHVAGILAGNGAASGGVYRGVAPGVNLINLRVSDKDGMTYESNVLDSLEWIYNNKDIYNIRVVNLSLNSTIAQSYHTSPLAAAVEILWFNGIVVVASAGNNGTGATPVNIFPPANDPFVITVGATEDKGTATLTDDNLAIFSAYGLTEDGFSKPELVAPGRNLVAPLSDKSATVYNAYPLQRVGDSYFRMSGTSMSAPVVSGAVALLLQDEPELTPDQVKYRLMDTANHAWCASSPPDFEVISLEGEILRSNSCSAGYLNAYSAIYGTTTANANQGILPSLLLTTGEDPVDIGSVGWNSVGWNSVGWNSVGWNSVGWNSVGWNSVGWNSVGWNSGVWDQ